MHLKCPYNCYECSASIGSGMHFRQIDVLVSMQGKQCSKCLLIFHQHLDNCNLLEDAKPLTRYQQCNIISQMRTVTQPLSISNRSSVSPVIRVMLQQPFVPIWTLKYILRI